MRWWPLLIASIPAAFADPHYSGTREWDTRSVDTAIKEKDAAQLATMVFSTTPADRERVLDALIDLGKLDRKNRARVPATDLLAKELPKLVASNPRAAKLFVAQSCRLGSFTATDVTLRCEPQGCDHSCMVVRGEATVTLSKGKWSIRGLVVKNVGDTGRCGDCL